MRDVGGVIVVLMGVWEGKGQDGDSRGLEEGQAEVSRRWLGKGLEGQAEGNPLGRK